MAVVIDVNNSEVAKLLNVGEPGKYALFVG